MTHIDYNPDRWERAFDSETNRIYYVNHHLRTTQWLNPLDQRTKPASFAECVGDQLPYGWERVNDPKIGVYYINHLERVTQFNDPRVEWQKRRIQMLDNYLKRATINNSMTAMKNQVANPTYIKHPTDHHHESYSPHYEPHRPCQLSGQGHVAASSYSDREQHQHDSTTPSTHHHLARFHPATTLATSVASLPDRVPSSMGPSNHSMADIAKLSAGPQKFISCDGNRFGIDSRLRAGMASDEIPQQQQQPLRQATDLSEKHNYVNEIILSQAKQQDEPAVTSVVTCQPAQSLASGQCHQEPPKECLPDQQVEKDARSSPRHHESSQGDSNNIVISIDIETVI